MMRIVKGDTGVKRDDVDSTVEKYLDLHKAEDSSQRLKENHWLVKKYYDMATDFYEYGWGQSFHFAPRAKNETFAASLARHEHYLALLLQLKPGMHVLDLGCGVGGPAREIARFSGCHVTGVNMNDYQLQRFAELTHQAGLERLVDCRKSDFAQLPFPDNSIDAVYQIEAFCHAGDLTKVFREVMRVLKPGGLFAGYDWVMTDKFDDKNPAHMASKRGIMEGNGLPDIRTKDQMLKCVRDSGMELLDARDVDDGSSDFPWYNTLASTFSVRGFTYSAVGRWTTGQLVRVLEAIRLAPKGTYKINDMLNRTATALVNGGKMGCFTATYLVQARKPLSS